MKRILNVRQAAKILGVSTNTMYKYLNQGTVSAARGQGQGSFRIPINSLENFLGGKIPEETITAALTSPAIPPIKENISAPATKIFTAEKVIETNSPTTLTTKIIRLLLLIGLLLAIIDTLTTPEFNLTNQLTRVAVFAILILIAYQHGGFIKK